jgi:diacylglycerol kinase (ATP)
MENTNKFNARKLLKSFGYAISGLRNLIRSEQNARIHLIISLGVIIAGFLLQLSAIEWCVVALCIGLVFAAEGFNTAFEKIVDHLFPEFHETARQVKDIAAGAVLICALMAAVCGIVLFLPKLVSLF